MSQSQQRSTAVDPQSSTPTPEWVFIPEKDKVRLPSKLPRKAIYVVIDPNDKKKVFGKFQKYDESGKYIFVPLHPKNVTKELLKKAKAASPKVEFPDLETLRAKQNKSYFAYAVGESEKKLKELRKEKDDVKNNKLDPANEDMKSMKNKLKKLIADRKIARKDYRRGGFKATKPEGYDEAKKANLKEQDMLRNKIAQKMEKLKRLGAEYSSLKMQAFHEGLSLYGNKASLYKATQLLNRVEKKERMKKPKYKDRKRVTAKV